MSVTNRRTAIILSSIGVAIQIVPLFLTAGEPGEAAMALFWVGLLVLAFGLGLYAKAKGHSAAFCVAALASLFGLLLVGLLEDRSARPLDPASPNRGRRMQRAAKASWVAPLIAFALHRFLASLASESREVLYVSMAAEAALVLVGFGAGAVALASVRKHGRAGILVPAFVGTTVNGLILLATIVLLFLPMGGPRQRLVPLDEARLSVPDAQACGQFARQLEDALKDGDVSFALTRCDVDLLVRRTFGGTALSPKAIDAARDGAGSALRSLFGGLAQARQDQMNYTFVTVHDVHGQRRAIFRLWGRRGLNYHDLVLVLTGGRVTIADIYVFSNGEFLSETLRRALLPAYMQADRSLAAKLVSGENDYMEALPKLHHLQRLANVGNGVDALAIYNSLPESVKEDKSVMLLRLQAAAAIGGDSRQYRQALSRMRGLFPNDPCLHLLLVDYYVVNRDYDGVRDCLQALRQETGDEEFLDQLEGVMVGAR
jgi:hypothetical protein